MEGESLCRTCRWAHIQRGFRQSEETIFCEYATLRRVHFKVAECTDYIDKTVPSRSEMESIAYLINVQPARKRSGFVSTVGFSAEIAEEKDDDADEFDSISE